MEEEKKPRKPKKSRYPVRVRTVRKPKQCHRLSIAFDEDTFLMMQAAKETLSLSYKEFVTNASRMYYDFICRVGHK